ncbi:primosomal protein N' [Bifidobacterium samirii]|uniref:Primosome assembly protein PriA n=1 Tax=Bifidobacterium samirii TaxID=2306974 RepID=A0A430FPF1_9BIFI|nr:primosomal protein N' [Bifidobacterium samirii]RSX54709.1 primosome assembly protein PriA [Bifidobacterium samirii]
MTAPHAEQLALDGLAPRRRRRRTPAEKIPAEHDPIAQVVLDIQATHLGRTFDYLIDEKLDGTAVPGALVRVRFGGQRVSGIIWNRTSTSDTPRSSLRYLERVLTTRPLVSASMRDDITRIADAYGGTRANIVRLAVPPRVERVDAALPGDDGTDGTGGASGIDTAGGFAGNTGGGTGADSPFGLASARRAAGRAAATALAARCRRAADEGFAAMRTSYDQAVRLHATLEDGGFGAFVVDALPGAQRWADDMAWIVMDAMAAGRAAVVVLPTMRETQDLADALERRGLHRFAAADGERAAAGGFTDGYAGDVAVLGASMPPEERYRAYRAVADGRVRCAIGPRAAMYAPVDGPALFAIVDDLAYQNMDGFMPYPNARGVLRLRAKAHGGVFVAMGHARSAVSQWETDGRAADTPVGGPATTVHALPAVVKEHTPWVRWLNRDELARLADPSIGARVPHTAVRILHKALDGGPVLLSIPGDDAESLACVRCHRQVRCARCTGPVARGGESAPRCRWCGAAAVNWTCPGCGGDRMRVIRVGAAGTAQELSRLFRGVPIVVSSPRSPRGIVETIAWRPQIVVATPGAEPRVRAADGRDTPQTREYRAVAVLDAWTSLYAQGVDARLDTLAAWMRAVACCAPRSRGGQALLIGETDPTIARSLTLWDPRLLAAREIEERREAGMTPVTATACVWGRRDVVIGALTRLGVLGGDWAVVNVGGHDLPAVLGPVPIAPPATVDARELAETADRVKAVVRVAASRRAELATRLRAIVGEHVAGRRAGELRFRLDPKDLI